MVKIISSIVKVGGSVMKKTYITILHDEVTKDNIMREHRYGWSKRIFAFLVASFGIVLASALIFMIAIFIKIDQCFLNIKVLANMVRACIFINFEPWLSMQKNY